MFLEQGDGGNIINVASFGALRTAAGAVYGASKAALVSLTKNTAYMYMLNGNPLQRYRSRRYRDRNQHFYAGVELTQILIQLQQKPELLTLLTGLLKVNVS